MAEMGFNDFSEPRIFEARRAVSDAIPETAHYCKIGLVIYGPNGPDECSGISLRFPPMPDAAPAVIDEIDALRPAGSTPLTAAVEMAANQLEFRTRPASIVLVTDGKETCGGMPCVLATNLANDGIDTTVHVIGFKVRSEFFNWGNDTSRGEVEVESVARCLSDQTGGTYTSVETVDQLVEALREMDVRFVSVTQRAQRSLQK